MDDFARFSGSITDNGEIIRFSVSREIIKKYRMDFPITRFLVKGQHPRQGSFSFFLKQDEDDHFSWISQYRPEFLSDKFIKQLGLLIEHHTA